MTTALLYDVHGNLPALEAVLADADAAGAERFVLGGDYALFGAYPAEAVTRLRELENAAWIRGNVDRWCAHPEQAPEDPIFHGAIPACQDALGERLVGELGELPEALVTDGILFCHASPLSDLRSFMPDPAPQDEELLAGASQRRVVFGHTHLQFEREGPGGVALVNPGSVGAPFDGDVRAAYALLDDEGSLQLRRVSYDNEAVATAVLERFGRSAWTERSARFLRTGRL